MGNHTELVREAAGAVIDPELRRSLGDLGMIGGVSTHNNTASVEVRLTIAGCPAAQKIESDVRAAALSVTGHLADPAVALDAHGAFPCEAAF